MTTYNAERTAYQRAGYNHWYLIPDGKKGAPLWFLGDGPLLRINRYDKISGEHVNLITKKDRVVLLEAINAGCFEGMWDEMKTVLWGRGKANMKKLMQFVER